jgi:hypothetical protein
MPRPNRQKTAFSSIKKTIKKSSRRRNRLAGFASQYLRSKKIEI